MTEPAAGEAVERLESHAGSYMKIWYILLGFTIAEYFYAMFAGRYLGIPLLIVGLVAMALYKATLVALHFMHLKFEGKWVYGMLIPTAFLMVVFMVGLTPDVALHDDGLQLEQGDEDLPVASGTLSPNQTSATTIVR